MTRISWLLMLTSLLSCMTACCQVPCEETNFATDSIAIVNARWQTDTLEGFYLKRHHFKHRQIFGANQYLALVEIPSRSHCRLALAYDTILTTTSELAKRYGALAAVNGSFFDMVRGNPICYLRIDSVEVGENVPGRSDTLNRKYYQYGTLTLNHGCPRIFHTDSSRFWERSLGYTDVMTAGPLLLHRNRPQPMRNDRTFVTHRHNRTAIGIRPDGTILLLTVDGRFKKESEGLSLTELTKVMRWLGCSEALNLDGGGSTTMFVEGFSNDGIVNHPSDNYSYDHEGQRPVSSILMVVKGDR